MSCAEAGVGSATPDGPVTSGPRPALPDDTAPAGTPTATAGGATSSPDAILAWTSGSSSRSFHIRLTTRDVTTMPITHAGIVIARIWVSPRLYGSTSVNVSIAAIAAETGEAASAMPDCTTVTVSGRDGRMWFL